MCCWQDEIHLLRDVFRKLFVKWALSPRRGENVLDNLLKFAEIMDVRDETYIIHLCYAAGW